MKKLKLGIVALAMIAFAGIANAGGVGYIDYAKVIDNYDYAKQVTKEVDAKGLEMQQFLVDKEKEYKAIDTPVQKKNFQDKVANDFKAKESAFLKQKVKSEDEIYNKIKEATKSIMVEHKLTAVISDRAVFVGGMDVTNLVIDKLKGGK